MPEICRYLESTGSEDLIQRVEEWLTGTSAPDPLMQLHFAHQNDPWLSQYVSTPLESREKLRKLFKGASHKIMDFATSARYDTWLSFCQERVDQYEPSNSKANIFGYFNTPTGMGQSARTLAEMFACSSTYSCTTFTFPCLWYRQEGRMPADVTPDIFGVPNLEATSNIWVANADEFARIRTITSGLTQRRARAIGYWVWETEELPDAYADSSESVDEIWTPSEFCAETFRMKLSCPIKVVPHCYKDQTGTQTSNEIVNQLGLHRRLFVAGFMFDVKSCVVRKNPASVIRAFLEAFPQEKDVRLVIKVSGPTISDFEYQMIKAECRDDRVIWLEQTIPYTDVMALMNRFDVYLSLHRSEGFGLTILEAMGSGVPVIATGYSGNTQFMSEGNSFPVRFSRTIASRPYGPYQRGTIWAEPDVDHTVALLRKLKSDRALAKEKANAGSKYPPAKPVALNCEPLKAAIKPGAT